MTEENQQTATPENKTAQTTEQQTAASEQKARPAGYEPIDFEKLNLTPEQRAAIEPRIHYLYGNVQAGKREREELRKWNEQLQRDIDDAKQRIQPLEKAQSEDRAARLANALKAAREAGDTHSEVLILKEIAKNDEPPKEEPKPAPKPAGFELLRPTVEVWAQEIGEDGNLKRPWLAPDHPDHELAQGRLVSLTQEWQRSGLEVTPQTLPIFLGQLEAKMGKANGHKPATAGVLSTSQHRSPAKKDTGLSIEEKHHADRIMTHIKEPEERYKRYAAQKAQMRPR